MGSVIDLGRDLHHWINLDSLDEDSIIVDAGANVGNFIKAIREHVNCHIYAIECSTYALSFLENENFADVTILKNALVGEHRDIEFTEIGSSDSKDDKVPRKYNQWGNIFGNNKKVSSHSIYKVQSITLADLLDTVPVIDYLKMDIEGSEYEVVESLSLEAAKRIKQISMETHDASKNDQLLANLKNLGFSCTEKPFGEVYCQRVDV